MLTRWTKTWSRLAVAVSAVAAVTAVGWGWSAAGGNDAGAEEAAVEAESIAPDLVPIGSCGEGCTHQ